VKQVLPVRLVARLDPQVRLVRLVPRVLRTVPPARQDPLVRQVQVRLEQLAILVFRASEL
jgi:hypothetical protein